MSEVLEFFSVWNIVCRGDIGAFRNEWLDFDTGRNANINPLHEKTNE